MGKPLLRNDDFLLFIHKVAALTRIKLIDVELWEMKKELICTCLLSTESGSDYSIGAGRRRRNRGKNERGILASKALLLFPPARFSMGNLRVTFVWTLTKHIQKSGCLSRIILIYVGLITNAPTEFWAWREGFCLHERVAFGQAAPACPKSREEKRH